MPAHKLPLKIDQGATFDKVVTWKTGTKTVSVPVDLTGCTARAQIRPEIDSDVVLLDLTTENERIQLGGATGTIRILIDAVTTAAFDWDTAVYDLEVVFSTGHVDRRLAGSVSVSKEVTRHE